MVLNSKSLRRINTCLKDEKIHPVKPFVTAIKKNQNYVNVILNEIL